MKSVPASVGFVGMLLAASAAEAQTAPTPSPPAAKPGPASSPPASPPPAPKSEGTTVSGVTVKADDPPVKSSIDRRSYSVAGDLQATTGSIADALKRVPSVEVDIEGNVRLRGESSVTILIDGKPSAIMRGGGRADALQQIPADQIERVEVLTNPGADFSPEGTGGIINLVTKKASKAGEGVSGSVKGNVGTGGRYNGGVSWNYNSKALTVSLDAGLSRTSSRSESRGDRTVTGIGGTFRRRSEGRSRSEGESYSLQASADYELDPKNRLSGNVSYFASSYAFGGDSRSTIADPAGVLVSDRPNRGSTGSDSNSLSGWLSWRREFTGEDHNFTLELQRSRWGYDSDSVYQYDNLVPPAPSQFERSDSRSTDGYWNFKGDYKRPMPGSGRFKAGFNFEQNESDNDTVYFSGPTKGSTLFDPTRSHRLIFEETVLSAYLSYEQPFGDLTVLAGLRYESATNDINLLTTGLKSSHRYDQLYPSLHLDYRLSETSRLKASYSLRISRPRGYDLDPFRTYYDAFNYRQGNPNLEPSQSQSWEGSYEYRKQRSYYLVTGFYRQTKDGITDETIDLGGGVLLTTKANLARNRSGGLELVANRSLTKTLRLNLTGTAYWTQIDVGSLGYGRDRSAWSVGGRASLDWDISPSDLLQAQAVVTAKRIMPQGYAEPTFGLNLGYRHKLTDRLLLTITASDVLDSLDRRIVLDAPGLKGVSASSSTTRGVFIGLRYRFGSGKPQRDPGFDYNAGSGAAGPPG
ncbi:outer membrane beta-barrel family protein [Caulobacter ginsengisoli]|uniref:outer membrane beta-barrel family protein n=1 Tax=Caulobacter ginsengisoli TaxID=400775 RepID=UPI0027D8C2D5|nr:outer membrane beta-barrel family protein [Caulobacter ginsengisoli]